MFVRLELGRKFKSWAAATLPTQWFDSCMRGGDCLIFSSDPLIIYVSDWVIRSRPVALLRVLRQFRYRTIHLLINLSWAHDSPWMIEQLKLWQARHLRRHPRHQVIFMANGEAEHRMLAAAGLGTAWVNQNVFVSPEIFRPMPELEKRFDAVYDARINPFKRHNLAAGIESLALITARVSYHHDESHTRSIRSILPQAYWFNDPLSTEYRWMSLPDINTAINQCRVGLCLSAEEGAMFASMQYLLAGLPVVSTKSRGGRDEFFMPDYVRIVDDNAEAVAEGVKEMCHCPMPPEEIRRRTLQKIEIHRDRLFELFYTICDDQMWRAKMRGRWDSWRVLPLIHSITPDIIRQRVERAYTPRDDA